MTRLPLVALLLCLALPAAAQRLPLWPDGAPDAVADSTVDQPSMTVFLPPADRATGAAAVIFPGGGYRTLAVEKEGSLAAEWLASIGVTAFVVEYRLGPRYHHPAMLQDAQRAIQIVRHRALEWGLDPSRVAAVGFSAGGHLAATLGTQPDAGDSTRPGAIETEATRPDLLLLVYPVISLRDPWTHTGSRRHLLGEEPDPALVWSLSAETQVTPGTPPTFLLSITDDSVVPVENSLLFYNALRGAGVSAELHLFESGRHGFGARPADPALAEWTTLAEGWLKRHGWLDPAR